MNLIEYCAIRGNQSYLAKKTGIAPAFINQIARGVRSVPVQSAAAIEKATNGAVTRQEMFPDTWKEIWPELKRKAPRGNVGQGLRHEACNKRSEHDRPKTDTVQEDC